MGLHSSTIQLSILKIAERVLIIELVFVILSQNSRIFSSTVSIILGHLNR